MNYSLRQVFNPDQVYGGKVQMQIESAELKGVGVGPELAFEKIVVLAMYDLKHGFPDIN